MKEKNKMNEFEFDVKSIGFITVFAWLYYSAFFRVVEGLTLDITNWIFYGVIAASAGFGVIITSERRNKFSLFVNTVIPFEIITIILYCNELKVVVYICLAVALIISAECIISLVRKPIRTANKEKRKKIKFRSLTRINGVRQQYRKFLHNRNTAVMLSISRLIQRISRTRKDFRIPKKTGRYSKMFMSR